MSILSEALAAADQEEKWAAFRANPIPVSSIEQMETPSLSGSLSDFFAEMISPEWMVANIASAGLAGPLGHAGARATGNLGTRLVRAGSGGLDLLYDLARGAVNLGKKAYPGKTTNMPSMVRKGYESVGGGKPPMPSRIPTERPQTGITSDFAPHEAPSMLGLEGGLTRDLTGVGRLTREASEMPLPSTWEQMLESGFTQPKPGLSMGPSSLPAARGEVIPYAPPLTARVLDYSPTARSVIEGAMRPANLPPIPKALTSAETSPAGLLRTNLVDNPIPLPASTMRPEARKIFDSIPIPEAPIAAAAKVATKTVPFWKRGPEELKLENLLSAVKGEKGKVIVGKPGSSHNIVLPGTIKSAQQRAKKTGFSDPSGKVFFDLNDLEAAGADAALAYLRKAIKQGKVLDEVGYEYVKKNAKVGA